MLKAEIITYAQDMTENKTAGKFDANDMLELRIARFVKEKEFWWRRKVCKFSTVAGQALYPLRLLNPPVLNVEKIRTMQRVDGPGRTKKMTAVWDEDTIMTAQETTVQGTPGSFTMEPGETGVIRLMDIPNGVYIVKFAYVGAYQMDASVPTITNFIPENLHYAIVDGLVMDMMMFLYGPENQKYATAQAQYQASVQSAYLPVDFTSERVDTFVGGTQCGDAAVSSGV